MAKETIVENEPMEAVATVPTVEQTSWGPFREPTRVTTPHGEFGVDRGQILTFEWREYFNRKTREYEERWMPQYQDVKIDPSDVAPSLPMRTLDAKTNAANVRAHKERVEARKARQRQERITSER